MSRAVLHCGDVREVLARLPEGSVQCVVTSPPYWGLRDYGVPGQLGLERTPEEYVANMVAVFREVRRVLRDDGVLWLNLGDSYASGGGSGKQGQNGQRADRTHTQEFLGVNRGRRLVGDGKNPNANIPTVGPNRFDLPGLKPKDLCMIPARVAMALQQPYYTGRISRVEDRAWLAAMIDGEGCIYIHRRKMGEPTGRTSTVTGERSKRSADSFGLGIKVTNLNEQLVRRCHAIAGVGSVRLCREGERDVWDWTACSQEARELLREIHAHLIAKQRQSRIGFGCPTSGERATAAWEALKILHRGGETDVDFPSPPTMYEPGWYLRSDVIWSKSNPMPESVTDRPTRSHEYLFLLTKRERYYYDAVAIAEPSTIGVGAVRRIGPDVVSRLDRNDAQRHTVNDGTRNARSVWTIATQPYPEAHFACVDQDTECLTAEGWRRHEDVLPGMVGAQYDLSTERLSWATVEDVARYAVTDQEMVLGHSRDLDILLTPNHRCVIHRRHPRTRAIQEPVIIQADALLPSHSIPTAALWSEAGDTTLPPEWAELLGWYIAEGHESKQSLAVEIYQSESANPKHVERIRQLLRQTGAEWTEACAHRDWRGETSTLVAFRVLGYAAARLRELAPGKQFPAGVLLWSEDRIRALLDGLIRGDGHTRLEDGRRSFVQKDVRRADMVQALAVRLGYSATLSVRPDGIRTVYLTKHRRRSFRGTAGRGTLLERVAYTGTVWCPKLPLGTWVARRNGRVFITGNTFPEELARRCILAGSSAKACEHCGAPWERVTEARKYEPQIVAEGVRFVDASRQDKTRKLDGKSTAWRESAASKQTLGWQPTCECENVGSGRSVVLDPFGGSGTVAAVATGNGRDSLYIDLNPTYLDLARQRIGPMLCDEPKAVA